MSRTSFRAPGRARRHLHRRSRTAVLAVLSLVGSFAVVAPAGAAAAAPSSSTQLVHAAAAQAGGFVPLASPQRLLDTRSNGGCVATTRNLTVTGVAGVPSGVAAVALNVAAVGAVMPGFLRTYPADQSPPATSTMNFQAAQGISNAVVAKPSAAGAITFQAQVGSCPHVVVDVTGYFTAGSAAAGGYVAASTPQRLLDTRSGGGACLSTTRTLQLGGVSGIPANASSVFVNVAAVTPAAAGTLKLFPSDADWVSGVNVTYNAGINVSTASVVKPGADGAVKVSASGGCTHVVVDVAGWTTSGTAGVGGVVPVAARRIMDTRPTGAGGCVTSPRELVVSPLDPDLGGVPAGAGSVLLAVTATGAATAGFGRMYPGGQAEPPASTINYQAGASITNLVMARVGTGGAVMFSAQAGTCPHLIVELLGYTVGDPATAPAPVTYTQAAVPGRSAGHTCAVTSTSQVRCWGRNEYGQLGNGTNVSAAAPVGVAGLPAASQVSAGHEHSCARTSNGGVWCWGSNDFGQLGTGTQDVGRAVPRQLFVANVTQVAAGSAHSCARQGDGLVKCWGSNYFGQLGDGTNSTRTTPTGSFINSVMSVGAGNDFTCALVTGGTVKCWGSNFYGQLGDGTNTTRYAPVNVLGVSGATQLTVGPNHACAVVAGGAMKCWGENFDNQLGDTTTTNRSTPVAVAGLSSVALAAAGYRNTCASTTAGTLYCWGRVAGTNRLTPDAVAGASSPTHLANGSRICVVQSGRVKCLSNGFSVDPGLGVGTLPWTTDAVRTQVTDATKVAAGDSFSCALVTGGSVKCWGNNSAGQLGNGTTTSSTSPVTVSGVSGATQVVAGSAHACALLAGGTAKCWGWNYHGTLGDGTTTDRSTPVVVSGLSGATQLAAGGVYGSTCALLAGGTAKCWGANYYGKLGDGTTTQRNSPVTVAGLSGATQLMVSGSHTCAVMAGGSVKCWGESSATGTGANRMMPTTVPGVSGATAISSGADAALTCVVAASNVYCWGSLAAGTSGAFGSEPRSIPGLTGATSLGVSRFGVCGLVSSSVRCWGHNSEGELGDRTNFLRDYTYYGGIREASLVPSAPSATSLSVASKHACAVTSGSPGVVRCWGDRSSGKLGVTSAAPSPGMLTVVN